MAVSVKTIQQPVGEPITLAEAKLYCRVDPDITADDYEILRAISEVREHVELLHAIALVSRTVVIAWDQFPRQSQTSGLQQQSEGLWDQRIPITEFAAKTWPERAVFRIPCNPLQRLTSLQYVDEANELQTLDAATYRVDYDSDPARVSPAYGQIWPIGVLSMQSVKMQAVVGYGPVTSIAAAISTGEQTVTPASMYGIYARDLTSDPLYPGTALVIDQGPKREVVTVTAAASTTFTATFAKSHDAGSIVQPAYPETIRGEMLMRISNRYERRDGQVEGQPLALETLRWLNWNGELR